MYLKVFCFPHYHKNALNIEIYFYQAPTVYSASVYAGGMRWVLSNDIWKNHPKSKWSSRFENSLNFYFHMRCLFFLKAILALVRCVNKKSYGCEFSKTKK